jgi:hypothetical protein
VRGEAIEEESPLGERLVDKGELPLLEVAQAAVSQSRGTRRCARCEIALLDEGDAESARSGIERCPTPDDSTADDDHIDIVVSKVGDRPVTRRQPEAIIGCTHATIILPRPLP